jgi:hypothetical protein
LILFAPTSSSGPSEIEDYEKGEDEKGILPSISANVVSSSSAASAVEVTSSPSFSISCSICTGSSVSVSSKKKQLVFYRNTNKIPSGAAVGVATGSRNA